MLVQNTVNLQKFNNQRKDKMGLHVLHSATSPEKFLSAVCRKASQIYNRDFNEIKKIYDSQLKVEKFAQASVVRVNQTIISLLKDAYPNAHIISSVEAKDNEGLSKASGEKVDIWVVVPMDGFANFTRGIGDFCYAISLQQYDKVQERYVTRSTFIKLPAYDELYCYNAGSGVGLNDIKCRPSERNMLKSGMIHLNSEVFKNISTSSWAKFVSNLNKFGEITISPSSLVSLVHFVSGKTDAALLTNLSSHTLYIASGILSEIGYKISNSDGVTTNMQGVLRAREFFIANDTLTRKFFNISNNE